MIRRLITWSSLLGSALVFTIACGSDDGGGTNGTATGGVFTGNGGIFGTGGAVVGAGGVVPGNGGTSAGGLGAGGGPANGGSVGNGGFPAGTGGDIPGSGGAAAGGLPGSGGMPGSGGGATGGAPGTGGTSSADCYCRGADPTDTSVMANGPYTPKSYTSGFKDGTSFGAATIYYPTGDAAPPFAGVVICPGFTAVQSSIGAWGPFLASNGIVTMTIDTNTTGDSVVQRVDALMDALGSLKAENTRADSPLNGKLSADRFGLMGWSMGGGGTWIAAAKHPELKTAISLAGHILTAGGAPAAQGLAIPTFMFAGGTDSPILGGGNQSQDVYAIIPETVPKMLYQIATAGHDVGNSPKNSGGVVGKYGLSFQKVFLEKDERYRKFLLTPGPGNNDWKSTVK
jgi:dienelactone hydrolase